MEKRIQQAIVAALCVAMFTLDAADITWGEAQNVSGDADVNTDGVPRYAYANADATVNGVKFSAGLNKNCFPDGVATVADVTLAGVESCNVNKNYFAKTVPEGASADYLQLIKGAVYNTSEANDVSVTSTVTLNNLIPGHDYIVQLWTQDYRDDVGSDRSIKIDDARELLLRVPSTGFGQHITGAFTADAQTQSFTVVGYSDGTRTAVSQFNSIQLRDVTPGCIGWDAAKDITADADVRLDGEPVFAAGWTVSTAVVNGVTFVPLSVTNATTVFADVKMTLSGFPNVMHKVFTEGVEQTLGDDYHRLLSGAAFSETADALGEGVSSVTLGGLELGGRYLVQVWMNDARPDIGDYRLSTVDGGSRVLYRNGMYGQHITGLFTATSASRCFTIHPMYISSKIKSGLSMVNAIQLRRLDAGASTHWRVNPVTKRVLDVRTDGDLLYAYNFGKASTDVEVNGVAFAGITAGGSSGDFTVSPALAGGYDRMFSSDSATPDEYVTLMKSSAFSKGGASDENPTTLTLKRLTPGHRYLVQIWVNDSRNNPDVVGRYQTLDGEATMEFSNENAGITPVRGDVATGFFTATATSQTISIRAGHWTDESLRIVQFNAMQVRDLGEAQGLTILSEDVPAWYVASGATTDLDGATRGLGTVSGSGIIANGAVSGELVVADGSAITLKDVTLSSGMTLTGASSVTFAGDADISGMAITLADPASLAAMGAPVVSSTGTLSGTPTFTFGRGGYVVKLTDDGYIVEKRLGLAVILY